MARKKKAIVEIKADKKKVTLSGNEPGLYELWEALDWAISNKLGLSKARLTGKDGRLYDCLITRLDQAAGKGRNGKSK